MDGVTFFQSAHDLHVAISQLSTEPLSLQLYVLMFLCTHLVISGTVAKDDCLNIHLCLQHHLRLHSGICNCFKLAKLELEFVMQINKDAILAENQNR